MISARDDAVFVPVLRPVIFTRNQIPPRHELADDLRLALRIDLPLLPDERQKFASALFIKKTRIPRSIVDFRLVTRNRPPAEIVAAILDSRVPIAQTEF